VEEVVRAAHNTRMSRMVWVTGACLLTGATSCKSWAEVHGGGPGGAGEGRSEVDVPLDLATTLTGLGGGGVQGERGRDVAWLRVDRGRVEGVEVLGGAGVHLAATCTCCSRCLITLSTLTSTPSTLPAMGRASASSL